MSRRASGLGHVGRDRGEHQIDRVEQRRAHQELLQVGLELADDLFREVLVQMSLGAAQRRDERADLAGIAVMEGGANELQRGGPALGSATELREQRRFEPHVVRLAEEPLGLARVEPKVVGAKLGHLAKRPQPGEPDRWLASAREYERHSLRSARQQLANDVAHVGGVVDQVEVVEHQHRGVGRQPAELVEEGVEDRIDRRRRRRRLAKQRAGRRAEVRLVDPYRRDEVGEHADPVAIAAIEPEPQHPEACASREVGEEGRLAVAGLRDEQDGSPVDLDRQPLEQPVAGQRLIAQRRRLDLADLNRVLGHDAEGPSEGREAAGRDRRWAGLDDEPRSSASWARVWGLPGRGGEVAGFGDASALVGPIERRER